MDKFSIKMKDRKCLVLEKIAANSYTLTVTGKEDTTFTFSKKRAAKLCSTIKDGYTFGTEIPFDFNKTSKSPAGCFTISQPSACVDSYRILIREKDISGSYITVFDESGISRKLLKKMVKVMKDVYGIK